MIKKDEKLFTNNDFFEDFKKINKLENEDKKKKKDKHCKKEILEDWDEEFSVYDTGIDKDFLN